MKIPHQRYSEISQDDVHDNISAFHAQQQYLLIQGLKERGQLLANLDPAKLTDFVGKEIEFWPGMPGEITLPAPQRENAALVRKNSKTGLSSNQEISLGKISQFLSDALTRKTPAEGEIPRRLYPSGGGLYPVEVFICRLSQKIKDWPNDHPVFHLKANSRELESMQASASIEELRDSLSGYDEDIGYPYFALVYCIHLDKAIFKYKYRGYRNALMEVGSMYQLCDLYSKEFDMRNRVWAGFYDGLVAKQLNINITSVLPCVAQFFGE